MKTITAAGLVLAIACASLFFLGCAVPQLSPPPTPSGGTARPIPKDTARIRELGDKGVQAELSGNLEEAFAYYKQAADLGDRDGMILAAGILDKFPHWPDSRFRAFELRRLASERGDLFSMYLVGIAELRGDGVPPNEASAVARLVKVTERPAVVSGDRLIIGLSEYELAKIYLRDISIPPVQIFRLMSSSARNGMPSAQYDLAKMYETGIFVQRSPLEAYIWYSIACLTENVGRSWVADRDRAFQLLNVDERRTAQEKASATFLEIKSRR